MKTNFISYAEAVKRFNNSFILCNNVPDLDPTIWDNLETSLEDENGDFKDIYQYYIKANDYGCNGLKPYAPAKIKQLNERL